mgnify:CR=1 FL=1|jgi:hypothetical protein
MIISLFSFTTKVYAQPEKCPVLSNLEEVTIKDKQEVVKALKTIIPQTYEVGESSDNYSEWNIVSAVPFPMTVGNKKEEDYYGMAKYFCGKEIADKSWLVRLDFPKIQGASASQGQLFLAKNKEKGWFVWFRYH